MQQGFVHPSRAHFIKPSSQKSKQPLRSALSKRHHATKRPPAVVESTKSNEDDLLVFGYASKLFPPDKHSASVAKNLHLIKWNEDGHANILIDRYDCRASLHDLSEFDGNSWNKKHQLSEEEVRLETYLDDERYRALHVEELEEKIRQEEELKRLHAVINETPSSKFSQVQFRYDNDNSDQESQKDRYNPCDPTNDEEEVDEKPFFAPASLAVPEEMEIPATEKMHAIIEKTAKFVSKQGAQMEIVLKAKQSSNSQFQFLQFGHYLNPYYKHIVTRIKEGKYNPEVQDTKDKSEAEESDSGSDDDSEGGYLHPSLFAATHKSREAENLEKTKAIRTVDPNHPLAKLIEKGRAANAVKQHQKMAESMQDYYKSNNTANGNTNAETTTATLPPFMSMSGHTTSIQQPTSTIQSEDTSHTQRYITTAVQIVPPPPDLQPVVENIARRVAMEGGGLEATIFTTNPVTFGFLNPTHELHPYYHYRKLAWVKHLYPDPTAQTNPNSEGVNNQSESEDTQQEQEPTPALPISFSIKPRNEITKKPIMTSQTTMMLKGNDSEDETEVENQQEKGPETVITVKSSKRKFTEEYEPPPVKITKTIPATVPIVPENLPIPAPTESQPAPVVPAPIAPPSSFTAVTPSGEEASIATLRQKQAARRAKALLFLNAKKKLQEQENGSKGTPERNITASAATEDIFDLSNPSSPATVDSPSRTAEKEGEVSRPKRTSRFDILPRGMTSLPLAVTQHPVMSAGPTPGYLSSRHDVTKTSRDVTPVSTRSDDGDVPSAYRVENEPARRSRERDRRKSRSSSRRHKHRSHDYRRHSDDDRSPSNHRSSRRYSRKTESRDSSKTSKRKKEKRRRKSRSKSRSSSNRSSSEREESQTKHSKVRHREKSRGGSSEDTSDVTPTHSTRDKNNDDVASDVSVTSEKYRSEGELTS